MKWSITQLIAVIDVEILWCKEHPDATLTQDYMDGFIKGLEQAQYILKGAENPRLKPEREEDGKK